jgi:hypothetical protein
MTPLVLLLVSSLFVLAYHYERNGNPYALGNTIERTLWATSFGLGAAVMPAPTFHWGVILWLIVGALIEISIPHAFAQNMGRWNASWESQGLAKYWPGYFVSLIVPDTNRTLRDILGMGCTGLLRGVIVFVPTLFLHCSIVGVLSATVLTMMMQPLCYWVGWYTPVTLWSNAAKSSQWGEFYIGIGWAIALAMLLWL